jgi:hypothetical protein
LADVSRTNSLHLSSSFGLRYTKLCCPVFLVVFRSQVHEACVNIQVLITSSVFKVKKLENPIRINCSEIIYITYTKMRMRSFDGNSRFRHYIQGIVNPRKFEEKKINI